MHKSGSYVYISSWANFGGDGGLGLYNFDRESGELEFVKMLNDNVSGGMSFLDKDKNILYLLNEQDKLPEAELGGGGGRIFVYKIDPSTGDLTELQRSPSYGTNPCYATLDSTGRYMLVAHHGSHSAVTCVDRDINGVYHVCVKRDDITLCLFPVNDDGTIGAPLDVVKHTGWRQSKEIPSAGMHTVAMAPSGNFFSVVDIGESRIHMYKIDYANKKLVPATLPYEDERNSLPRYCLFHPTLPYFYVNHEMGSLDVTCFKYNEVGSLERIGKVSSVPEGHVKKFHDEQQDFRMHPSGKYIYDAVNGPDVISVFEVDEKTGLLTLIQNQKVEGEWMRSCALSPDGRFLIATCLKSEKVYVFSVGDDGRLSQTDYSVSQSNSSWSTFYCP